MRRVCKCVVSVVRDELLRRRSFNELLTLLHYRLTSNYRFDAVETVIESLDDMIFEKNERQVFLRNRRTCVIVKSFYTSAFVIVVLFCWSSLACCLGGGDVEDSSVWTKVWRSNA